MKYKILVVDDIASNRLSVRFILKADKDYIVYEAIDGSDAIRVAMEVSPDLVLLDIMMPVLDGFEVLSELKKRNIKTKIIMFSAYFTDIPTAIKCIKNGACDFMVKPLGKEELIEKIKRALILESTYNTIVATAPIVNDLIEKTQYLSKNYDDLSIKHNELLIKYKKKHLLQTIIEKMFYSIISFSILLTAYKVNIITNNVSAIILFITVFLLLLIPSDKIKEFSTKLFKLRMK